MIEAWAGPFSERFKDASGVRLYELALIEQVVSELMGLMPHA